MSDLTRPEDRPLRIGYVLKQYPRLSETFILSELLGLEECGVELSIYSLRHATEGRFHPAIGEVKGSVHYLADTDKTAFLDAVRALPTLRLECLPDVFDFIDRLPPDRRPRLMFQAIEIARAAEAARLDHLHAHFLTVAAHTAYLVHLLTGLRFSVTAHAKDIYRHTVDWALAETIATAATAVVTVCDANLNHLTSRLGHSDANLIRIYNGLGPQEPPPTPGARVDELVLGVGRLVEKKGFDLLIDAIAILAPSRPRLRCVIVGDGDQRAALEQQVAANAIADRVTFTGAVPQNEVSGWLRRAQVLAAPCRVGTDGNQDALPTVLIEALGAGLPSISTAVAGIPEIITDGIEGMILDHDDSGALATALAELLGDPGRRASMATAGPAKLARRFDRRATIEQLINTFRARELVA